jgi:hypothetical protein
MNNKFYNIKNIKKNIYSYEEERYRLFPIDSRESSYKRFQTTHMNDYVIYKFMKPKVSQKNFFRKMSKPRLKV